MRSTALAASTFAAWICVAGCDQLSQPKTFDDCILEYMGRVTSDRAAVLINESCRAKFPDTAIDNGTELADAELSKLTGRLGVFGNRYGGSLYNGNTDITVTSIGFTVRATLGDNIASREYRHEVMIPPLTAKDISFNIVAGEEGTEYLWEVASARGKRK